MIQAVVQIKEIDILHIDRLVLDHLQFPGDHLKVFVLYIVTVIQKSILIELHHVQDTLIFTTNEETLNLLTFHLSEKNHYRSFPGSN